MYGEDKDLSLQHKARAQGKQTRIGEPRKSFYHRSVLQDCPQISTAAGNFIEYGAFGILILALLEYNGVLSTGTLWWSVFTSLYLLQPALGLSACCDAYGQNSSLDFSLFGVHGKRCRAYCKGLH